MSGELRFGADGFVDMDVFPDDGTDLDPGALADLREALLADPVTEPGPDEWGALFDAAVAGAEDTGPFDVGAPDPADEAVAGDLEGWLDTDLGDEPVSEADPDLGDEPANEPAEAGVADEALEADPHDALDLDVGADAALGGADLFDPGSAGDDAGSAGDAGFDVGDAL